MNTRTHAELASFIWSICNLLRARTSATSTAG